MSKWTDFRDSMESALDIADVTEAAKEQVIASITGDGMDAISAVADKFVAQIQAQADTEQGWNMVRDKFVLPLLINGVIWAVKLVLSKSTTTTQPAAQPEAQTSAGQQ